MPSDPSTIIKDIERKAGLIRRPVVIMELCGTHSESIAENAIKDILPKNIKLVSGPGCPICVTDQSDVDVVVGLAKSGVPIAAYGDAVSVPGSEGSLEEARRNGAKVFIVYDTVQALEIKKKEPDLVFWGVGFETTAPGTAWAIKKGLRVFSSHKVFPPAMEVLLSDAEVKIDGFLNPGHVSAIIGLGAYQKFDIPQVVAGFEARDILLAIEDILDQIISKKHLVENEYGRLVKDGGNLRAQKLIYEVFEISDGSWRGLGMIKDSSLKIRGKYRSQDAEYFYKKEISGIRKSIRPKKNACRCGDVLRGRIKSSECPLFRKVCSPDNPMGACMVSREGSCNIEYRYGKH